MLHLRIECAYIVTELIFIMVCGTTFKERLKDVTRDDASYAYHVIQSALLKRVC